MSARPEDSTAERASDGSRPHLHPGGFLAILFASLQLVAATATAYVCGLWATAYLAWVFPGIVGLVVTGAFFLAAVTSAVTSFAAKGGGKGIAALGLLLAFLAFGGLYGGCRKGVHDFECENALPGTAKCAGFW
jgi:hypothetical protein